MHEEENRKRVCALCGSRLGSDDVHVGSDGNVVHDRCAEEWEDLVYFHNDELAPFDN